MDNELYHYGVLGMRWGMRKKHPQSSNQRSSRKTRKQIKDGEKTVNAFKKAANELLDKADRDNFFNSDSIFSEKSMKRASHIRRARDAIDSLDYKTLTSSKGKKHLIDIGKKLVEDSLDDADSRSFFNDDWNTMMKKRDMNDTIRELIKSRG